MSFCRIQAHSKMFVLRAKGPQSAGIKRSHAIESLPTRWLKPPAYIHTRFKRSHAIAPLPTSVAKLSPCQSQQCFKRSDAIAPLPTAPELVASLDNPRFKRSHAIAPLLTAVLRNLPRECPCFKRLNAIAPFLQ